MTAPDARVTTPNVLTTTREHQDAVVESAERGVATILSKREGFIANRIYRSTRGDAVLNMTDWTDLEVVKSNHEANEQDPEFKRQMAAVDLIASSVPNVYVRVANNIDRQTILATEDELIAAVLAKDRGRAEHVLHPDFVATGHAGNFVDKIKYLDTHFSPERDFTVFETRDQSLLKADGAVVVSGWTTITNAASAEQIAPKRYTAVYVPAADARWQILTWQETPILEVPGT